LRKENPSLSLPFEKGRELKYQKELIKGFPSLILGREQGWVLKRKDAHNLLEDLIF